MEIREPRSISAPPVPHLDAPPGEASAAMMALCTAGQGPARSSSFRFRFEERHGICFSNTERDLRSKATSLTAAADTQHAHLDAYRAQPPNPSACALLRRPRMRPEIAGARSLTPPLSSLCRDPLDHYLAGRQARPESSTRARETSLQPGPVSSCLLEVTRESNSDSESDLAGRRARATRGPTRLATRVARPLADSGAAY